MKITKVITPLILTNSHTAGFTFLIIYCLLYPGNFFAQAIAGGKLHSISICTDYTVQTWGSNSNGQLADGTTTESHSPLSIGGLTNIIHVAGGGMQSVFLKSDGTAWACGDNSTGALGDGTTTDRSNPVQVSGLSNITAVACGGEHSLFLLNDGTVWVCGSNEYGQLGDGTATNRPTPQKVSSLSGIIAIAGGYYHSIFLKSDGTVWTCGRGSRGQMGDGATTNNYSTPVQIHGPANVGFLTNIVAIAGGGQFSLFIKNDGTVWGVGHNSFGQLGDGTNTVAQTSPVQQSGLTNVKAIAIGYFHSLFLKTDSTVWACGRNQYGEIGDGTTIQRTTPIQASSLSSIVAISCGEQHSLFQKKGGTVWTAGLNGNGELGDATTTARSTPVQVLSLCTVLLPIELLSFDAKYDNGKININWSTASETNNDYFTVERSSDGKKFNAITYIKGAGNSNHILNYQAIDSGHLYSYNYYRLKQTDFDGKHSYSALVAIDLVNFSKEYLFNIYPNPIATGEQPWLLLNGLQNEEVLVVVYDTNGKEYFSKIELIQQTGENTFALDKIKKLPRGIYYVTASSSNKIFGKKLVIQ
jgi:hypothetical protein